MYLTLEEILKLIEIHQKQCEKDVQIAKDANASKESINWAYARLDSIEGLIRLINWSEETHWRQGQEQEQRT